MEEKKEEHIVQPQVEKVPDEITITIKIIKKVIQPISIEPAGKISIRTLFRILETSKVQILSRSA